MMKLLIGLLTALNIYLLMRLGAESQIASTIISFFLGYTWREIYHRGAANFGRRITDIGGVIETIPDLVDRKVADILELGKEKCS